MKKFAFISDVHGNIEALKIAIKEIKEQAIDTIICLGDVYSYNASQNECAEFIVNNNIHWIAGNHDLIAANLLSPLSCSPVAFYSSTRAKRIISERWRNHIKTLPLIYRNNDILAFHGSYRKVDEYLSKEERIHKSVEAMKNANESAKFVFFGHTHSFGVYTYTHALNKLSGQNIYLNDSNMYLINVGSLGEPRNNTSASYCIFDYENKHIQFRTIAHDFSKCYSDSLVQKSRVYNKYSLIFARIRRIALKIRHKIFPIQIDDSSLTSLSKRLNSSSVV